MATKTISEVKVSIIMPVYNALSYTRDCLQSLDYHTESHCELIVVDNASTDGTADYLRSLRFSGVGTYSVIKNTKNLGYARACNQGFRQSAGRYIVFLNNDTIVTRNWLEPMLECFAAGENVGIVTPKLLFPQTGKIQYAGVSLLTNLLPHLLFYGEDPTLVAANICREVPIACGGCIVMDRGVLAEVGLFDERYVNGMEDVDLSLRVRKAGYKTIYCPQSVVYHYESVTEGRSDYNTENIRYYLDKWQGKIKADKDGNVVFPENKVQWEAEDENEAGLSYAAGRFYPSYRRSGL